MNKREKYLIALVILGLYLSIAENFIPKPFPWMKLGLSNIAVLIALIKFDSKMALEVTCLRIFIQALMLGTLFSPGFIISALAGTSTTIFTIILYKLKRYLSIVAISSMAAFLHNIIQLIVVYFLMFRNISLYSKSIMSFIMIFLSLGIISGMIVGIIVTKLNLRRSNIK